MSGEDDAKEPEDPSRRFASGAPTVPLSGPPLPKLTEPPTARLPIESAVVVSDRLTNADPHAPTLISIPEVPLPGAEVGVGHVIAGRYEVVRLLGAGGMGKVWKGTHLGLGVAVAIKTMHPDIAATHDFVRRFQREAHAASVLNHPNVVRVLDFGEDRGVFYLVMEFLEGRSLTQWLWDLGKPAPIADVGDILGMLCDAFTVAHTYGVVHRDLKPDNVFLTDVFGKRVAKVVDFGLAHVDDARDSGPTLTARDVIAGTPEYMSPEQCRSLVVGPSTDIYALGCVLTYMLQQKPPFHGSSAIEILAKQMFSPPPPLKRPDGAEPVPPLLERLRLDLLAKAPEKRPHDAAAIKARLLEALSVEATAERLPDRKGDEEPGSRAERAPTWTGADRPSLAGTSAPLRPVGLMRLGKANGIGPECETGLAAHAQEVVAVATPADIAKKSLSVLVLDAGTAIDEARAMLAEIAKVAPKCRTLVCGSGIAADAISALAAAGAADVLRYPITPDALGKKVDRVLRRGR